MEVQWGRIKKGLNASGWGREREEEKGEEEEDDELD